jgi:hypothetical protein
MIAIASATGASSGLRRRRAAILFSSGGLIAHLGANTMFGASQCA